MLGTDPECFVLDKEGNPVPAWRFFPPKEKKVATPELATIHGGFTSGAYFRDGYALEFNTSPTSCRALMANELREIVRLAMKKLPDGYTLTTTPAVKVKREDLEDVPSDCQIFGCDPAYNAYTQVLGCVDIDALTHEWRYGGGHMHIEVPKSWSAEDKFLFVKLCDLYIGLPLAYIFADDANRQRRRYYGRAGECRFQSYPAAYGRDEATEGVEYRVPSPQIWNDHRLTGLMFGVMRNLLYRLPRLRETWDPGWEEDLQGQINECDVSKGWLQTVPGYYTPEHIEYIRDTGAFRKFKLLTSGEGHDGWSEWASSIRRPIGDSYSYAISVPGASRKAA